MENVLEELSSPRVTLSLPGDKLLPQGIDFYVDVNVETY